MSNDNITVLRNGCIGIIVTTEYITNMKCFILDANDSSYISVAAIAKVVALFG